jgi:type I restriction enzyme S subunit
LYGGRYPFIQTSDITNAGKFITNFNQPLSEAGFNVSRKFPAGTLTMAIAANVGDVSILTFDACFPDSVIGIRPNDMVSVDYLYHCLTAMKQQLVEASTGSAQSNLNLEKVGDFVISVPPIEEQARIVEILDKFDALVNDISFGLPAEITARRHQYEHYRDWLLTFKEAA